MCTTGTGGRCRRGEESPKRGYPRRGLKQPSIGEGFMRARISRFAPTPPLSTQVIGRGARSFIGSFSWCLSWGCLISHCVARFSFIMEILNRNWKITLLVLLLLLYRPIRHFAVE